MGSVRCVAHGRISWAAYGAVRMGGAHVRHAVRCAWTVCMGCAWVVCMGCAWAVCMGCAWAVRIGGVRRGAVRMGGAHVRRAWAACGAVRMGVAHGMCACAACDAHWRCAWGGGGGGCVWVSCDAVRMGGAHGRRAVRCAWAVRMGGV